LEGAAHVCPDGEFLLKALFYSLSEFEDPLLPLLGYLDPLVLLLPPSGSEQGIARHRRFRRGRVPVTAEQGKVGSLPDETEAHFAPYRTDDLGEGLKVVRRQDRSPSTLDGAAKVLKDADTDPGGRHRRGLLCLKRSRCSPAAYPKDHGDDKTDAGLHSPTSSDF